jgi:hypothetical protein
VVSVLAWLSVGLIGPLYFALDKNVARKRVAFPVFLISLGVNALRAQLILRRSGNAVRVL